MLFFGKYFMRVQWLLGALLVPAVLLGLGMEARPYGFAIAYSLVVYTFWVVMFGLGLFTRQELTLLDYAHIGLSMFVTVSTVFIIESLSKWNTGAQISALTMVAVALAGCCFGVWVFVNRALKSREDHAKLPALSMACNLALTPLAIWSLGLFASGPRVESLAARFVINPIPVSMTVLLFLIQLQWAIKLDRTYNLTRSEQGLRVVKNAA